VPGQPLRWGAMFCSAIRRTFPLPSGQRQTARDGLGEQRSPRAMHIPPSSPRGGEEGGEGEGEDHQAFSAASVLKPLQLISPHASPLSPHCCRIAREIRDGLQAIRGHGIITYIVNLCQGSLGEPG